jgi:Tfp pilus assembly protein PilF
MINSAVYSVNQFRAMASRRLHALLSIPLVLLLCCPPVVMAAAPAPAKGSSTGQPAAARPQPGASGAKALPSPAKTTPAGAKMISPKAGAIGDKWAVVIGISKFADPRVPGLKYSSKDAKDFYDYLIDPNGGNFRPDHVRLLTDEEATKVNIMDTLGDSFLPHAAAPEDLVVVYLSTHGSPAGADVAGISYLVAYDTQVDKLFSTGIEMAQVQRIVKERSHTNRILLLLDACYSGAGTGGHKNLVRRNIDPKGIAQGLGCLVITSSSPEQRAWESDQLHNSYFTHYLIEGLKEEGSRAPIVKVFDHVRDKVADAVRLDKGETQTPVLGGTFNGPDLVLALPPTVIRTAPPAVPFTNPTGPDATKSFTSSVAEYVYHMRNAHSFMDKRKWFEALHELESATRLEPNSVEAFLVYADVLDAQGNYRQALEAAKRSVSNDENSSEAHERLGRAYWRLDNTDEAVRQVEHSLQLDPDNTTAQALLGVLNHYKLGRIDYAEQQYRKALEINPLNLHAMINLGYLLQRQERNPDEVLSLFTKAVEADADDPDARLALGQLLLKQNKVAEAEAQIKKGLDYDPNNYKLYCEMGNICARDPNRYDEAEKNYRKAVSLADKNAAYPHFVLGRFLVDCRGRFDEGEQELRAALSKDDTLDECSVALGDLVIERRKAYDEADSHYRHALTINPRNKRAHIGLARIHSELLRDYTHAQDELMKALAIDPKCSEAFLLLGLLFDGKLGRTDEAEKAYKNAINADPENAYAHYYLALLMLTRSGNKAPDAAVAELRKAIAIKPNIAPFHTKLGWLLTDRYKQHKEAEAEFRAAINSDIADTEAHYRLGILLIERLSQRKEGEHELKTAFQQNPNDRDVKSAYDRFVSH